jgi:PAS domain S-box-containing protein
VRRPARPYLIAIAALAAAVLVRWMLDPVIGDVLPLVTLFGAVAVAVWVGGVLPATVVAILGYLAADYLFIPPRGAIVVDLPHLVGLVAYLSTCSLVIAIGEAMRRAQGRARERGDLLRITLASIGDAMITTDNQGRVTYLNAVAESLTGWSQQDAAGQPLDTVFRVVDELTGQPIESPAARALREGTVVGLANHTLLVGKDGAERPVDDSAAPIRDEQGRVSGCVLIFRDVSERRRLEKALAARFLEARLLASIVESSDDAIVRKSLDSIIQSWNAGAERIFGYSAEEAVGRHISIVIPPDRLAEEDRIIATLKEGRRVEPFETERVRRDGRRIRVSVTISPIKDEAGNVVAASKIARDVTKQRQAESEREMFATLIESSTDFIGIADMDGVPIFVNRAGLRLVGLDDMDQARKVHVKDFFFPEDQARIMDEFFPSVAEKGHGEVDVRFRNFKTGDARWMAYKVLKLLDGKGQAVGFATVSQDVTERRRLEDGLRQLAANLSEEGRRKNEFLATLAHELRNPLAPLTNMLEILRRTGTGQPAPPQALDTMGRQLSQLVRLVDDLLDLSRITHNRLELRKAPVELGAVIDQAVEASKPLVESMRHELRVIPSPQPIHLDGDAARLAQVFANLLNNSAKYTSPGGKIEVKTERRGEEAVVTVKDNGAGIPPDRLDSVFEMFNQVQGSLERSQGGLGIGLTLVRRLVQMHGGTVQADSAGEGKGAEFVVRLPIHEARPAASAEPAPAREPSAGRRILVVDDNHDSAESLAMLLGITGNKTFTAHDGADALDAAARHRPDVVLLDIGLPTLNGYEVCRRIREEPWGKEMCVIALTGWGQDEDRRKSHEAGFDGHLVKPVNYPALMALLDSLGVAK